MQRHWVIVVVGLGLSLLLSRIDAEPPVVASTEATMVSADNEQVARARERAALLQKVYIATLEVMHERYFHGETAMVPARALEDVFKEMSRQEKIQARWISVNTKAMSVNHEPKSDFEKLAAKEIAAGKESMEQVDDGLYQRAAAVPLADGCVACHTGFFAAPPKTPRFAGLVLRIPLSPEMK